MMFNEFEFSLLHLHQTESVQECSSLPTQIQQLECF